MSDAVFMSFEPCCFCFGACLSSAHCTNQTNSYSCVNIQYAWKFVPRHKSLAAYFFSPTLVSSVYHIVPHGKVSQSAEKQMKRRKNMDE